MRFVEKGSAVPLHLLEQQSLGNVIFFCGAGVSVPAGLATFWQLTDRVARNLDSKPARKALEGCVDFDFLADLLADEFGSSRRAKFAKVLKSDAAQEALANGVAFDRVFALLSKKYGRQEIDRQIFAALEGKKARTLTHHRNILRLSKNATGETQLVTTNFDTLFEKADPKVKAIVPPALPRLNLNQKIGGVVYLHGRLTDASLGEPANYVISSPDFGRAYLAEGWASRFVRELRERHTLVFLDFSADDPPMRYLLEGLNDREGVTYENPIYAFAPDEDGQNIENWVDKGVTAIPYSPEDKHTLLWETIRLWADAASDPERWQSSVIALASRGPRDLKSFERGLVVVFIRTVKCAKAFAEADPPPPDEWHCQTNVAVTGEGC